MVPHKVKKASAGEREREEAKLVSATLQKTSVGERVDAVAVSHFA